MKRTLECRLCHNCYSVQMSELPQTCPGCYKPAHWRVVDPDEYDRRFLRSLRITHPDDE